MCPYRARLLLDDLNDNANDDHLMFNVYNVYRELTRDRKFFQNFF